VPQPQLARALGFIEGTASPFANTLRAVIGALESGYRPTEPPPDPLEGVAGKENIFVATGEHRPTEPATDSQIQRLFSDAARFKAVLPGYEIRHEQTAMAGLVGQAFRDKTLLLVEAGTGVGKSLGYLVPALLSGGRVVVSTHTKNLQDQLFYDEIPRLGRLFKFGFRAVLLKGRRNYLCRSRWLTLAATPERIGSPAVREQAALIVRWADATQTGDVSEIAAVMGNSAGSLFNHIVSEPGYCTSRVCSGPTECPLPRIRRAAQLADIVVVNHSLVLSDLDSEGGLLGDAKRIIFDEAHHLEEVATDAFSIDLTTYSFRDALDRVGRLCRRNGELWVRLAADNEFSGLVPTAEQAANDASELKQPVDALFDALQATLALAGLKGWMSAAESGRTENKPQYPTPFRYHAGDSLQQTLAEAGQPLLAGLKGFGGRLNRIAERLREVPEERFPPAVAQELLNALNEIAELHDGLGVVLEGDDENRVFWVELPSEKEKPIRLRAAPLDVSVMLRDGLWQKLDSATLTSATLATAPSATGFDHLRARLGLTELPDGRVRSAVFGSPFDYPRNCLVCYPSHLPSPTEDAAEHCRAVAAICAGLAMKLRRNTLLLFTSYDALWRVERELKRALLGAGLELLVGGRIGRERLVRRFRKSTGALLLGTDAFWEGIDVPGEALEMVVIPRLPFDVPNDPVVAARIDKIRESGGNPFYDYQIPTAVLRLRQGAGRLIRTTTDRGVVLVLDPRVATKGYGRHFRNALPGISVTLDSDEALMQRIGEFFK
jgi:Rad3-related DNA helicase